MNTPLTGGIPSRLSGLITELLRHVLSLGALAAEETRVLIQRSITGVLVLIVLILMLVIAYVSAIIAVVSLLALGCGFGWVATLGLISLLHLLLAGGCYLFLRLKSFPRPYEATSAELQRNLEALGTSSRKKA